MSAFDRINMLIPQLDKEIEHWRIDAKSLGIIEDKPILNYWFGMANSKIQELSNIIKTIQKTALGINSKWIDVKEELPPENVEVLATNGKIIVFAQTKKWYHSQELVSKGCPIEITYWQPLPEPPTT